MVYFLIKNVYFPIKWAEWKLECKAFGQRKDFHILNLDVEQKLWTANENKECWPVQSLSPRKPKS